MNEDFSYNYIGQQFDAFLGRCVHQAVRSDGKLVTLIRAQIARLKAQGRLTDSTKSSQTASIENHENQAN